MKVTSTSVLCFMMLVMISLTMQAQDASVKLGSVEIGLNQYFTITITVENDRLKEHSPFPDIEGFVKRGTSSSTSTSIVNGQMTSTQSITQNYQATTQGKFPLKAFSMNINGIVVQSSGAQITVGEPVQQRRRRNSFFSNPFHEPDQPTEFMDVEADAFLTLTNDKKEVYIGEGFTTTLAFYVSETNQAEMRFYDLGSQITEIVKKIKPANCWEESFNIDNINGEVVRLNNRNYTRYKIFQASYFPLNVENISFPSVSLKMIKYKVAKNPTFFGRNRQEDHEIFYSREKSVSVKNLPPHPLREQVAVGNYQMNESISSRELSTGQSFNYEFIILGEGNISAIKEPAPTQDANFDFYTPNVKQNVNRGNSRIRGSKAYDFYAIPNEPGAHNLSDYFSWIFFNPKTETYDTLQADITVRVTGESLKNQSIASNDLGEFYDRIGLADNRLSSIKTKSRITTALNLFAILMMGLTAYILFRKHARS